MMRRLLTIAILALGITATATASPSWVERLPERFSVGPVVGQEYRYNAAGEFKSTGILTVGAVHYNATEYLSAFGFYGLSNRTGGDNSQVAGAGIRYTDLVGITIFAGADVDSGAASLQYATSWFLAFGLAFHGLEFDLTGDAQ
jgi:hypothetical protein